MSYCHFSLLFLLLQVLLSCKPTTCLVGDPFKTEQHDGKPPVFNDPTVTIATLVRNKAYALPYSLAGIERLNYNATRLSLIFFVDHTRDNSLLLLQTWRRANSDRFGRIQIHASESPTDYPGETWSLDWTNERFLNLMRLRQLALESARSHGSQFVFYLDADALITHPETLRHLTSRNLSLIAPLLNCSSEPTHGANFWGDIDPESGYYARSSSYLDIQKRRRVGLFPVAVVHTAFLLSLDHSGAEFRFYPVPADYPNQWPLDDLSLMHWAAATAGIQPALDNSLHFGVYASFDDRRLLTEGSSMTDLESGAFKHALLEFHYHRAGLETWEPAASLKDFAMPRTPRKLGFDLIFVINLARRSDRLERMRYALTLLGLDWQHLVAVDGRQLNATWLQRNGIQSLSDYADPYHGRGLTMGEVGCFLSHHAVWQALANDPTLNRVLVLEDDVRFHSNFEERLQFATGEADRLRPGSWELLYIGRKIMFPDEEEAIPGSEFLTHPAYTYWTLGYALTKLGARKLISQRPLSRLIAVDEFLPVMFDRHPNARWKAAFQPRDLQALSTAPLLLQPNYYIGMPHYVSDTEGSDLVGVDSVCRDGAKCKVDGETGDAEQQSRYSKTRN